jgi:TonB family protein
MKAMRPVTLWHAVVSGVKIEVPPADSPDAEEEFLIELLERQSGKKPRDHKAWIARRASKEETPFLSIDDSGSKHLLLQLTKNERKALSEQLSWSPEQLDFLYELAKKEAHKDEASKIAGGRTAALATVSDFPDGLVADVLDLTGCKPDSSIGIENAEVDFTLVGRPSRIRFVPSTVDSAPCREASRAIILNSVAPPRALSPKTLWDSLLVFLDPDFLSCLSEGRAFPLPAPMPEIAPPVKIADFAPVYPPSAIASRVTGTVHLESVIKPSGCVSGLRVIESPDSRLALASIIAASKWRYQPSLVDGKPVPIKMALTVNFALH